MQTYCLEGVPRLSEDTIILVSLKEFLRATYSAASSVHVGLEGPDGRVYRVIVLDGSAEAAGLCTALLRLGLSLRPARAAFQVVLGVERRQVERTWRERWKKGSPW